MPQSSPPLHRFGGNKSPGNDTLSAATLISAPTGLRFVEVRGDRFEPIVRRGDFVLVAPCDGWRGEADYLMEVGLEPALYRCTACGYGDKPIRVGSPNPLYRDPVYMTRARFDAAVIGIVVMTCCVPDRALLRQFVPTI